MTRNLLAIILPAAILAMYAGRPWIDPTLALSGLFLLACGWAIALVSGRRTLHLSFPLIPLAYAVIWGMAWRSNSKLAVAVWAGNLLVFCLALQVGRPLLEPLVAFASVVCVLSVLQWGPFVNRDHYAAFIELVLPLALVEALRGGPHALRHAVISAAMYASVIAGASRAGAILTTAEIMALYFLAGCGKMLRREDSRRRRSTKRDENVTQTAPFSRGSVADASLPWAPFLQPGGALGFGMGNSGSASNSPAAWRILGGLKGSHWLPHTLFAALFVLIAGGTALWHRFQDRDPFGGRSAILSSTVAMVRARPWTGFGLGSFQTVYPAYASVDFGALVQHAHNDWAEWAAEGGIPFSLGLLSIAIWSVRKAWRAPWAMGAVAVFIHSLVDFPLQKPALELWLFALLGILAAEPISTPDSR